MFLLQTLAISYFPKQLFRTSIVLQVGNTPLHLACQANEVDTVEVLIEKGADLNCLNQVRISSFFSID